MMNVMKRAWEIYRTLTGDRIAKLSVALHQAWEESRKPSEEFVNKVKTLIFNNDLQMYNNGENIKARVARGSEDDKFLMNNKAKVIIVLKDIEVAKERKEAFRREIDNELRTLAKQTNKKFADRAFEEIYRGANKEIAFKRARIAYANYYDSTL